MRFPPAHFSSTHHHRPRNGHHAMPYDREKPGDYRRVRGTDDRGMKDTINPSDPFLSPQSSAPHATNGPARDPGRDGRGIDARSAPRGRTRDGDPLLHHPRPRSPSPSRPYYLAKIPRHISGDRSRNPSHRRPDLSSRSGESRPLPSRRGHEAAGTADIHTAPPQQSRHPFITTSDQPAFRPRSPPPAKRQRSRSPFTTNSQHKRPRQDPSPRRLDREPYAARSPHYSARSETSIALREDSLTYRERRRLKNKATKSKPPPIPSRGRSPSPRLGGPGSAENPNLVPLGQRPSSRHDQGAPSFSHRRSSPRRRWSPHPPQRGRRQSIQDIDIHGRQTPEFDVERYNSPPPPPESSLGDRQELFPLKNRRRQDRSQHRVRLPEPLSGANNIEVNMSARGNFRGAYGGQYSSRGHYNQGSHDSRNYAHSSDHGTPNSSLQGSPPAQSPYSGGRGSWSGQQQFSPQK